MIVMPIGLIGMIKMLSADFAANFVTPAGIIATTIGVALFVAAYYVGKAVLNIKV
jgi:tight adherence protein B